MGTGAAIRHLFRLRHNIFWSVHGSGPRPQSKLTPANVQYPSGVAWALTTGQAPTLADVNVVNNWGRVIESKVPSLYTYSRTLDDGELWGYDIGDNAYVIRWSKLELEAPSRLQALKTLKRTIAEARQLDFGQTNVLQGQIPRHLTKSASDVVTDYLIQVAGAVRKDIENKRDARTLLEFPIDLVITHPAVLDLRCNHSRARELTSCA